MKTLGMLAAAFAMGCGTVATNTAQTASAAKVGATAPDFTLTDLAGQTHTLSDLRGKTVVLEWFNPGCPYVVYAHEQGPLVDLAKRTVSDDIVWLAINSGAPGKQGHGVAKNQQAKEAWNLDHPVLVDESGTVGRRYGATNTPQMYIVDPTGKLVYQGALDNAPFGKGTGTFVNYVEAAMGDLGAGRPVKVSSTKAYGCSVKYGS